MLMATTCDELKLFALADTASRPRHWTSSDYQIFFAFLRDDFIDLEAHRRLPFNVDDLYAPYDRAE